MFNLFKSLSRVKMQTQTENSSSLVAKFLYACALLLILIAQYVITKVWKSNQLQIIVYMASVNCHAFTFWFVYFLISHDNNEDKMTVVQYSLSSYNLSYTIYMYLFDTYSKSSDFSNHKSVTDSWPILMYYSSTKVYEIFNSDNCN